MTSAIVLPDTQTLADDGATLGPLPVEATGSMALGQSVASAIGALRANKLRAVLTTLGIIFGVAAVIVVVALGEGAQQAVQARLAGLGTNMLTIFAGSSGGGGIRGGAGSLPSLTEGDVRAIQQQVPEVVGTTPGVTIGGVQVIARNQNWNTQIQGGYPIMFAMQSWQIAAGVAFDDADETSGALVCDLGQTVAANLFGDADPVGQMVLIRNVPFKVKGLLAPKGSSGERDQDDIVLVPFRALQTRLLRGNFVPAIFAQVDTADDVTAAQQEIGDLLRARHHLHPGQADDFTVFDNNQVLQTVQATNATLTWLLTGVAAVSLVVGGIGIMNIMLVSVTERTREIGIRLAVGARRGNILSQFLIEAVLLSVAGGILGIILGSAAASLVSGIAGLTPIITPEAVVLSFAVAGFVGVFFGYYPARRASRLDPIEALRRE
jgi:putative ABC transport system permease protein